ncbi:MAG: bifunctional 4-hydroxy-2-oxoglutarate aldolase/2-dehydro-3-deoxy-phosphogluconate aldolase [Candidatus Omnitrophota bacterium]
MDIAKFKQLPVMGVLRGVKPDVLLPLLDVAANAGLETVEITMNTKDASSLIRQAVKSYAGRLCVGAGTVLDLKGLKEALEAGATFIVTPVLVEDVAQYCAKNKIPVFPGALTPLEVYRAWQAGATMVKVFPAKVFGPEYFKELKGPFQDIELLACGGVTPESMQAYFDNGASAITFGASVFRKDLIDKKDYATISLNIGRYLSGFKRRANNGS